MDNNNERFEYTYSAKQQEEIERIRQKYMPKQDDAMTQLRKLDQKVTQKGTMLSIIIGVVGCLIFGTGMSCVMLTKAYFGVGIVIGIIGFVIMGMAYPLCAKITQKEREKYAPQILELTEQLLHK